MRSCKDWVSQSRVNSVSDLGPIHSYFFNWFWDGVVFTSWGGRDTLHGDTALLIPTGIWLWVGAFLSIACSVQWVSDWYRIPGLFHRHCPILILWAFGWRADWSKGLQKLINKGIYPTNIYGVPAGCQALGTGWWAKRKWFRCHVADKWGRDSLLT